MNEICFCAYAFGKEYIDTLYRLSESITNTNPDANKLIFDNVLPKNARPHNRSYYGFKVHAVNEARELGYKKIIYVDSTMVVLKKVSESFEYCKQYGLLAVPDANLLYQFCSDKALNYYGISRDKAKEIGLHFVGGSYYLFDFDIPLCEKIFNSWYDAEVNGIFGAEGEELQGHRHDETCLALSLYECGSEPINRDLIGYNTGRETQIVVKKHFR